MNKIIKLILVTSLALSIPATFADDDQMKETLMKIINQLETIKPLITEAQKEQTLNPRVKLQFDEWVDAKGVIHPGLRQDINEIEMALTNFINHETIEPRSYDPIKNDFVGD